MPNHWEADKLYSVIIRFMYLGQAYNSKFVTKEEAEIVFPLVESEGREKGRLV